MSGQEVLVELQRLDPAVKVMVFSGYAPAADKIYGQVMAVVEKPPPPEMVCWNCLLPSFLLVLVTFGHFQSDTYLSTFGVIGTDSPTTRIGPMLAKKTSSLPA